MRRTSRTHRDRGFSLTEMLCVMGIMALLLALIVPALSRAREMANRAKCLANLKQLVSAWQMYAEENNDWIVKAHPDDKNWPLPWVLGSGAYPTGPSGPTITVDGNSEEAIKLGALYKYLNTVKVYQCPSDDALHRRSYSINCYLNGETGFGQIVKKRSLIARPQETFVFIDENDYRNHGSGYNLGSFAILRTGDTWVDYPGTWHNGGACLAFVDGHVEYWKWLDPRTLLLTTQNVSTPNNPDLKRLQQAKGEL